jgi:hypothetical protein
VTKLKVSSGRQPHQEIYEVHIRHQLHLHHQGDDQMAMELVSEMDFINLFMWLSAQENSVEFMVDHTVQHVQTTHFPYPSPDLSHNLAGLTVEGHCGMALYIFISLKIVPWIYFLN